MQEETKKEHTATEKQPEKKKVNLDIRPYLAIGLTVILIVVVCIAIFFVVLRFDGLFSGFQKILQSLQAILVGVIVAYLLNPIMKWFERFLYIYMVYAANVLGQNAKRKKISIQSW